MALRLAGLPITTVATESVTWWDSWGSMRRMLSARPRSYETAPEGDIKRECSQRGFMGFKIHGMRQDSRDSSGNGGIGGVG
ncbi:protein of unknown function [Streptomyces murinus]